MPIQALLPSLQLRHVGSECMYRSPYLGALEQEVIYGRVLRDWNERLGLHLVRPV